MGDQNLHTFQKIHDFLYFLPLPISPSTTIPLIDIFLSNAGTGVYMISFFRDLCWPCFIISFYISFQRASQSHFTIKLSKETPHLVIGLQMSETGKYRHSVQGIQVLVLDIPFGGIYILIQ